MRLYSLQMTHFLLTEGRVDHSQSKFYNLPELTGIKAAYAELAKPEWFGTDQIVWCYVDAKTASNRIDNGESRWELEVPFECIRFVDDRIWNKLIGSNYYPNSLSREWRRYALDAGIDEDAYREEKKAEYLNDRRCDLAWMHELFVEFPPPKSIESISALLRHPIPSEWVVSNGRTQS